MSVFARYTRRSLARSPARTLVTIIGIALSMSLFTAVIEGAYSGMQYMVRTETEANGAFHGFFRQLSPEETDRVLSDGRLARTSVWRGAGWARTGEEEDLYRPYLYLVDVDGAFQDLVAVHMVEGRMPEREGEIAIPLGSGAPVLADKGPGDTVVLAVGRRVGADGRTLGESDWYDPEEQPEDLEDVSERTYTITGVYEGYNYVLDNGRIPAWIVLTRGGGTGESRVFFTLEQPRRFQSFVQDMQPLRITAHTDLLRWSGVMGQELLALLYGFAGILIFLVAFGSVSLIYNSFSISVSERTKQFGLLRSLGATRRQIRWTVLYEALLLSAAGIPAGLVVGCAGIGVTLWALRDTFAVLTGNDGMETQMALVLSPGALLLAAAICLVTVLISAWYPARRAIRLTAMDAIRQSQDVKVRARDVRVPPLAGKLLGFPGLMAAKNVRRDRKRGRATVFSLFLSVTLFISASSLCAYVTDAARVLAMGDSRTDVYTVGLGRSDPAAEDPDAALARLMGAEAVTEGLYYVEGAGPRWFPAGALTEEFRRAVELTSSGTLDEEALHTGNVTTVFLSDGAFRDMCAQNGLDAADYLDPARPAALLYDHYATVYQEDGRRHWGDWRVMDPAGLPAPAWELTEREIEGWRLMDVETGPEGGDTYLYWPEDYVADFLEAHPDDGSGQLDRSLAMALPEAEAVERTDYVVGAVVEQVPFAFRTDRPILFYPFSLREVVDSGVEARYGYSYAFLSTDHARSCAAIQEIMGPEATVVDQAAQARPYGMAATVVQVFAYGFITLISLIAAANVFNTISTNVALRQRELAMLRSIGLSQRGLRRMMDCECAIYGLKGLAWGLPASVAMTFVIYRVASQVLITGFYIPWTSVAVAVGSVFAVVFAAMLYATGRLRRDDLVSALKTETF